ncbi:MAG: hypothetical protein H6Q47_261, partial [Deltaproteobacteria bacterium]|nr:hypothetical protein [Deltaproteobacteria bacterium]
MYNNALLAEHSSVYVVNHIRHMISPLNLEVSEGAVQRINSIISIIDFKYFFGGYIGMFNLAKSLTKTGFKVRMIIVDECKYEPEVWRREIKKYEGLEDFFELIEVAYAFSRSEPIQVSKDDVFLANSWWTAHVANYARQYLNSKRFLYFSQEYEPAFYRMGTCSALALESYTFPHYAIFSTEILREYFRQNRLGVFREGQQIGDENSVAIENALLKFEVDRTKMMNKGKKKFLFYARPEEHAARNMFELGIIALSNVIGEGHFDTERWEFYGIGSVEDVGKKVTLQGDISMRLLPKMSLNEYKALLPEFDIGLSLMLSPHPSIVPLEMAAAGMFVVTNTFANKTAESLRKISTNIIPAEHTVGGVAGAIIKAIEGVDDYESRIRGAGVNWSQSWQDTFNPQIMEKIKNFINDISGSADNLTGCMSDLKNNGNVKAFLKTIAKNPDTFVDFISPYDDVYKFHRNSTTHEEMARYSYFNNGWGIFQIVKEIVRSTGKTFSDISSFLDFACGYGRFARFLVQEMGSNKVWACDIDRGAVDFQKKYFNVNGFYSESTPSRTNFPKKFELICVVSLFSHLPKDRFREWLETLYNILEDDGVLIFSTHGELICPPEIKIDSSGFTFFKGSESE